MKTEIDLDYLLHKCGKSFADLESSGLVSTGQLKILQQQDYGKVSLDTVVALLGFLDCDGTELFVDDLTPIETGLRKSSESNAHDDFFDS